MKREFENRAVRAARVLFALVLASMTAACATHQTPPPTAQGAIVERLRDANLAPAATGSFVLAPGRDAKMDKELGVRASGIEAMSGSFAQQLKYEIEANLKASGLYDGKSQYIIEGQLTDNRVDAAIGTGSARIAARIWVTHAGSRTFDKEVSVESTWDSSFFGGTAIPTAITNYTALYKAFVAKLVADPDFLRSLAR